MLHGLRESYQGNLIRILSGKCGNGKAPLKSFVRSRVGASTMYLSCVCCKSCIFFGGNCKQEKKPGISVYAKKKYTTVRFFVVAKKVTCNHNEKNISGH